MSWLVPLSVSTVNSRNGCNCFDCWQSDRLEDPQTLASVGISLLVVVAAFLAIRPKFSEGRLRLDNKHLLTPMEVQAIPDGVLPVVLGRDLGDTEREFKTQLLRLIMERSGVDFDFGLTAEDLSQDAAIDALASGQLVGDKNPHAITIGAYGAGRALNARLRVIPIPITGGVLGLRVGWTPLRTKLFLTRSSHQ